MPPTVPDEACHPDLEPHEQQALEAVREACAIAGLVAASPEGPSAFAKADASPVTVADFAVQCWIAHTLTGAGSGLPVIGEETADGLRRAGPGMLDAVHAVLPTHGRPAEPGELFTWLEGAGPPGAASDWWLLDPIDGTRGFLRREQFAVCLALVRAGEPVFGILGCPALPARGIPAPGVPRDGVVLLGRRGVGAWQARLTGDGAWQPIRCTDASAEEGLLRVCESRAAAHGRRGLLDEALAQMGTVAETVRIDSQCKYALVARGDADVFARLPRSAGYVEKTWDHAAGSVIATAAGARVSDLDGAPLDFSAGANMGGRGVLVANPRWHARLLAALHGTAATGLR